MYCAGRQIEAGRHRLADKCLQGVVGPMVFRVAKPEGALGGQHANVLARAVAAQRRWLELSGDPVPLHGVGERRMGTATQVRLDRTNLCQHGPGPLDMQGLAAVRPAHQGQVGIRQIKAAERATGENGQRLGGFCGRSRQGQAVGVAQAVQQGLGLVYHGQMHLMAVFKNVAPPERRCCHTGSLYVQADPTLMQCGQPVRATPCMQCKRAGRPPGLRHHRTITTGSRNKFERYKFFQIGFQSFQNGHYYVR